MAGYSVTFSVVDEATAKIDQINRRIQQMRAPLERQARAMQQFINVSGLGKIAEGFTSIARSALGALETLSRLVPVMGTLTGAASLAGMARLVKSWADWAVVLRTDADRIGTTAQTLETLQDATRDAGGSVDDLTESLKGLTEKAAAARIGLDANALAEFSRASIALGHDVLTLNGHLRATTDILPDVLQYLDSIKNPADRMRRAVNLGNAALFNQVEAFRRAQRPGETFVQTLQRVNAEAAKRQMLTAEDIVRSQRFAEVTGTLTTAIEHLGNTIGSAMSGPVSTAEEKIADLIDQLDQSPNDIAKLTTAVELLSAALGVGLVAAIAKATTALAGWVASPAVARLMVIAAAVEGLMKLTGEAGRRSQTTGESYGRALAEELLLPRWVQDLIQPEYGKKRTEREHGGETYGPPIPPGLMPKGPSAAPAAPSVPGVAPGAVPIPPRAANVTPGNTAALQKQAIDYFVKQGWSPAQAAGILANVQTESSLRANAVGDAGAAYGLGQWHADRQAMFKKVFGHDIRQSSFGEQLAFVDWELKNTERGAGERLRGAATARQAGGVISQFYERPGDVAANIALRGGLASKLLAQYPGQAAPMTAVAQAAPPPVPVDLGQYRTGLAPPRATGAPAQVTGGAPVNGSVDVTITHKNPPPSDTLAATSTGDGINLAPPRTERQQLNAA